MRAAEKAYMPVNLTEKRIQIYLGHYGSGKSSLAVNVALALKRGGAKVTLADMDIVNPYFRSADSRELLEGLGIEVIASRFAGSNVDVPAMPPELYGAVSGREGYALLDVGGDDRGAVALGRYAPAISEQDYMAAFVVNFYRPLTASAQEALAVLREVEAAGGLPCTALINNSNLGPDTRPEDVLATLGHMEELSGLCGMPVWFTAADEGICRELTGSIDCLLPVKLGGLARELNRRNN